MGRTERVLVALSGVMGAGGVALAALASHGAGGSGLQTAALLLIVQAAAVLALSKRLDGGFRSARFAAAAAFIIAAGAVLFAADLAARGYLGDRLFPGAAPIGGALMIGGWIVVSFSSRRS